MNKARPVFQHRHYKAIAVFTIQFDRYGVFEPITWTHGEIVDALADMFAADNSRFDRARFIAAASGKPSNGRDKVRS